MLSFLPRFIIGILAFILYVAVSVLLSLSALLLMCIWLPMPVPTWRKALQKIIFNIPSAWSEAIRAIMWLTIKTQWEVHGLDQLNKHRSYLLI